LLGRKAQAGARPILAAVVLGVLALSLVVSCGFAYPSDGGPIPTADCSAPSDVQTQLYPGSGPLPDTETQVYPADAGLGTIYPLPCSAEFGAARP
jgi:hypothetical protein